MQFPVWRELKLRTALQLNASSRSFECSFPFEGNWNSFCSIPNHLHMSSLNAVSRLKGIETFPRWHFRHERLRVLDRVWMQFPVWRELKLLLFLTPFVPLVWSVWMQFPVWRELKLGYAGPKSHLRSSGVWMQFPVWRELKHGNFRCTRVYLKNCRLNAVSRLKGIETILGWGSILNTLKLSLNAVSRLKGIET